MSDLTTGMSYDEKAIRIGTIAMICAAVANFAPAAYVYLMYGIIPPAEDIFKGSVTTNGWFLTRNSV